MPSAEGEAIKSPKTPRRLRTGDSLDSARQVRFGAEESVDQASSSKNRQPTSFPQVGPPPVSGGLAQGWHTAADPTRSLGSGGPTAFSPFLNHFVHHPFITNTPFIGNPHHHHHNIAMADYANAAPHPAGVNFQPPVPDNTFGPIPHLYVPRFDTVPVGQPNLHYVPLVAYPPRVEHTPATYSVMVPQTLYTPHYNYHASVITGRSVFSLFPHFPLISFC
ncbi:hypothetical protein GQ602_003635 [Ophiocordyceps camponoti-floridani]|uniref:Uncharacterized protein n=1 Tax=Ophiocordyceps camponoti-floridani TaxID=2030778 RepID=A0A8H4Q8I5_9HYPO|nr:hypothetical protein GQ602_003635 [Ophiocordyceps camponoti-floridani]